VRVDEQPFGQRLRALRERAGLTQEELAERAGLSANAISSLERGARTHPYPHTIRQLADGLGLSSAERAALAADVRPRRVRTVLPAAPTPLLGRVDELTALAQAFGVARLVTLIGPGGVGKTRLALAMAERLGGDFPDGAVFVALASLSEPEQVLTAIADALGLRELGTRPLREILHSYLRGRRMLLVLDNFEHLTAAAADIAELLAVAPRLTVLVTSRSPLHVRAEQVVALAPLAADAAVQLFCDRASQAAAPVSAEDAGAVAAICDRLDNLPLAIELAAARGRVLPPAALLARLDPTLSILDTAAHDLPERQQTLRRTVEWSHALLGSAEQAMFRGLGVFSGGWTLDAARAIGEQHDAGVVALHAGLTDASLISRHGNGASPRFHMLETIRAYAVDRLDSGPDAAAVRDRHADYYQTLAVSASNSLWTHAHPEFVEDLHRDHDNLRTAWVRLLAGGHRDRLADAATGLMGWWLMRGHLVEGETWVGEALAGSGSLSPLGRAKLLIAAGTVLLPRGRHDEAADRLAEAAGIARAAGDWTTLCWALGIWCNVEAYRGRLEPAMQLADEAELLSNAHAEVQPALLVTISRGLVAIADGRLLDAAGYLDDAAVRAREHGALWTVAVALGTNGRVALLLDDSARAGAMLRESVLLFSRFGDTWGLMHSLVHLADTAALHADPRRAATLYGAVDTLIEQTGALIFPAWQQRSNHAQAVAIGEAGLESFGESRSNGRQLHINDVIALALD